MIQKIDLPRKGLFKVRVSFNTDDEKKEVKITPYSRKKIKTLKLVELTKEDYSHKFEDREFIKHHYSKKGLSDDVLFYRGYKILDSSYCNIAFYDGNGRPEYETEGDYGEYPPVYQELADFNEDSEEHRYQPSIYWTGMSSALCFRRQDDFVIDDDAEFVGHVVG